MIIPYTLQLVAAYEIPTGASEFTVLLAMLIAIIGPFAGTYVFMKNASKLFSAATGAINKAGAGARKWANGWAKEKQQNSRFARARAWNKSLKEANRIERYGKMDGPQGLLNKATSFAAGPSLNPKKWASNAGKYQASAVNRASIEADKIFKGDKENAAATFAANGISGPLMVDHARSGRVVKMDADGNKVYGRKLTEAEHAAAVEWTMSNGKLSERQAVYGSDWATRGRTPEYARALDAMNDGYFHVNKDVSRFGNGFGGTLTSGSVGGDMGVDNAALVNMANGKTSAEAIIDNDMAKTLTSLTQLSDADLVERVRSSKLAPVGDEQRFVDAFRHNSAEVAKIVLGTKELRAKVKQEFLQDITGLTSSAPRAASSTDAKTKNDALKVKKQKVDAKDTQDPGVKIDESLKTISPAPQKV